MTLAKNLKNGDKIVINLMNLTVENVEVSKIAKHGKAKCRIEALTKNNEKKVLIVLADDEIASQ
ncbi:hypothetical protein HY500_02970 [Candidatus Woesearchaeota archaeon]|nr:hypothetical protein [Candidatus Woesearchaeota archaeon]